VSRLICLASLFSGRSNSPSAEDSRFAFAFDVALAGDFAPLVVGFMVMVGSIKGGSYARYIGFTGVPSHS